MKLVGISDTHMRHAIEVPDGDVLIHCGDFSIHRDTLFDLEEFAEWFLAFPHKHKILVPGNHDWCFETDEEEARSLLPGVHVLIHDGLTIDGINFWGSSYQPIFCNWAFNVPDATRVKLFKQIPRNTHVLITHTPPLGRLDKVRRNGDNVGCKILSQVVADIRPEVHFFGHIHEAYGMELYGSTAYINCAICDTAYESSNKAIVYSIHKDKDV